MSNEFDTSTGREMTEIDPKYQVSEGNKIPDWIVNEALLINDAINAGKVTKEEAQAGRGETGAIFEDKEIIEVMKRLAAPKMFVELPWENLDGASRGLVMQRLFRQEMPDGKGGMMELGDYLAEKNISLSICMSSLDKDTADAIRYLNEKKIPVIAWVVVEDAEGYWTNHSNIVETVKKTQDILDWAKENDLNLHALGFDSEKPIQFLAEVGKASIVSMAKEYLAYRAKISEQKKSGDYNPQQQFNDLVEKLNQDGVQTEIYAFPNPLKKVLGGIGVDVPGNERLVEMLYVPPVVARVVRDRDAIPAFGIAARPELPDQQAERPGRDFAVISGTNKGLKFEDIERKPVGKNEHLSQQQLDELVEMWLDQEINVGERVFKIREVYLFAMNDYRVAQMLAGAIEKGFEKMESKI